MHKERQLEQKEMELERKERALEPQKLQLDFERQRLELEVAAAKRPRFQELDLMKQKTYPVPSWTHQLQLPPSDEDGEKTWPIPAVNLSQVCGSLRHALGFKCRKPRFGALLHCVTVNLQKILEEAIVILLWAFGASKSADGHITSFGRDSLASIETSWQQATEIGNVWLSRFRAASRLNYSKMNIRACGGIASSMPRKPDGVTQLQITIAVLTETHRPVTSTRVRLTDQQTSMVVKTDLRVSELKAKAIDALGLIILNLIKDNGENLLEHLTLKEAGITDKDLKQACFGGEGTSLGDGSVLTWGDPESGGDSRFVQMCLEGSIVDIFSTHTAFAALKDDGRIITWGNPLAGGDCSSVESQLQDVTFILGNQEAFVALKNDGGVVAWGNPAFGGDLGAAQPLLQNGVQRLCATGSAFAALKKDGRVVAWGNPAAGGETRYVYDQLQRPAVRRDGTVVAWGDPVRGGDVTPVLSKLKQGASLALVLQGAQLRSKVVALHSTDQAFSALKESGNVISWGNESDGGDILARPEDRGEVAKIFCTEHAFAALDRFWETISQAHSNTIQAYGGNPGACRAQLAAGKVIRLFATRHAFAAAARIAFNTRSRASKLGLDRIAKQKRLEKEMTKGPVAALSLDADPLADAPKPTLQQIEQGKQRKRITAESGSEASGEEETETVPQPKAKGKNGRGPRSRSRSPQRDSRTSSADLWEAAKDIRAKISQMGGDSSWALCSFPSLFGYCLSQFLRSPGIFQHRMLEQIWPTNVSLDIALLELSLLTFLAGIVTFLYEDLEFSSKSTSHGHMCHEIHDTPSPKAESHTELELVELTQKSSKVVEPEQKAKAREDLPEPEPEGCDEEAKKFLEVILERFPGEAWGLCWHRTAFDEERLIFAGVDPNTPAGQQQQERKEQGLPLLERGDELICVNDLSQHSSMKMALVVSNRLRLKFLRSDWVIAGRQVDIEDSAEQYSGLQLNFWSYQRPPRAFALTADIAHSTVPVTPSPPHLRARSDPPKQTIHQAVDESADELRVTPSAPSVPRNDGISPHRGLREKQATRNESCARSRLWQARTAAANGSVVLVAGSQAYALQTPGGVVPCNGLMSPGCSQRDAGANLAVSSHQDHPRSMNLQIGQTECLKHRKDLRKGILCCAVQASWKHAFAALWRYAWGNAGGILCHMSLRWFEMV
eukprot:s1827_g5.t1